MVKKRLVVKIGSSVLVSEDGSLNKDIMEARVGEICELLSEYEITLVTSASVRLGRSIADLSSTRIRRDERNQNYSRDIIKEQMQAAVGQPLLMANYINYFSKHNIVCAQVLATANDYGVRERYIGLKTAVENMLAIGWVPVLNENDVLSPDFHGEDISDNDRLAAMTAAMTGANTLIVLTSVEGFLDGLEENQSSSVIPVILNVDEYLPMVDDSESRGKGGMQSKLEIARLVTRLGLDMHMANGSTDRILHRILSGEQIGTYFPAHKENKIPALKQWLATAPAKGILVASTTLADALRAKRPASILCSGIDRIEGTFSKGDVIAVYDDDANSLGKGQARLSSVEIASRVEEHRKSRDLGFTGKSNDIAIHYDYFVFVR